MLPNLMAYISDMYMSLLNSFNIKFSIYYLLSQIYQYFLWLGIFIYQLYFTLEKNPLLIKKSNN